jgi:hypothetical protein
MNLVSYVFRADSASERLQILRAFDITVPHHPRCKLIDHCRRKVSFSRMGTHEVPDVHVPAGAVLIAITVLLCRCTSQASAGDIPQPDDRGKL